MGIFGDAWDAVSGAAGAAWDWASGDGPASWIRGLLVIIGISGGLAIGVFLFLTMPFWVEVAMVVVAVAFVGIVIYDIATRNSKKS